MVRPPTIPSGQKADAVTASPVGDDTMQRILSELWAYFQAVTSPFRSVLDAAKDRPDIEREVLSAIEKYWDEQKVNLTAEIVLAGGSKPD